MRLGRILADHRAVARVGIRELSRDIGVPAATLNRIERDHNCDAVSLSKIVVWLLSDARRPSSPQEPTE
jgi:DNA-binding MurR/RpiR family transcriptional regulator